MPNILDQMAARVAGQLANSSLKGKFASQVKYETTPIPGSGLVQVEGQLAPSTTGDDEMGGAMAMANIGRPAVALYAPLGGAGGVVTNPGNGGSSVTVGTHTHTHDSLAGVTANQHHTQLHDIVDPVSHTIVGARWNILGAIADNTIGLILPSAIPGAAEAILKSDNDGLLTLPSFTATTSMRSPLLDTATGHMTINPAGDVLFPQAQTVRSDVFTPGIPIQGWWIGQYNGTGTPSTTRNAMQIYSLTLDELRARTFVADEVRVDRGETMVTKSYGILSRPFTTPSSISGTATAYFDDSPAISGGIFANGDYLLFRIFDDASGFTIANILFTVSNYTNLTGDEQSWTLTLVEGLTNYEIRKGGLAWDWGVSGQGYIHSSVVDTTGAPYIDVRTWATGGGAGGPLDGTTTTHVRIGKLISSLDNVMSPSGWGLFADNVFLKGALIAGGGTLAADANGLSIVMGEDFAAAEQRVSFVKTQLGGTERAFIGVRDFGANLHNQLTTVVTGNSAGGQGQIALRSRMYGDGFTVPNDTQGTTLIMKPEQIFIGPGKGVRIASATTELETPVPAGELYVDTIHVGTLIADTVSGESMGGQTWTYPGAMTIDAESASNVALTVTNSAAGRADLNVDRDIIVGGNVDGVDIGSFYSAFGSHGHAHSSLSGMTANDHHAQSHVLATTAALGSDHTVSGLTAGQVLRANSATVAYFTALVLGDLPKGSAQYQIMISGANPYTPAWALLSTLAGAGLTEASGVLAVGAGNGITVNANDVALTTPGSLTATSTNSSSGSHTHAIDSTIARSAITLTAGAGLTGGGDLTANRTFTIGAGFGITVNADDVALASSTAGNGLTYTNGVLAVVPSGLGLSVGADVVTLLSSSNPGAAASILATDASGYLQLARIGLGVTPGYPLHVSGAGKITGALVVDQDFTVGSNVLYVNQAGTRVGINRAPDQQFDLDVAGAIRGQYLIGQHAIQLAEAIAVIHFDGPAPYRLDYSGSTASHMGIAATDTGGVIYRPGKFNKGIQIAEATTNLCTNPSFEAGGTNWSANLTTMTYVQNEPMYGKYALRMAYSGAGDNYASHDVNYGSAVANKTFTVSFYARRTSGTGTLISVIRFRDGGGTDITTINPSLTTEWQRFTMTGSVRAGYAGNTIQLVLRPTSSTTIHAEYDGIQIEEKAYVTPYCDGSLGAGHTWSGTANASSSSRTAAYITYTNPLTVPAGTIMFYADTGGNPPYRMWIGDTTAGIVLYLDPSDNEELWVGSSLKFNLNTTIPTGYNHFAITWSAAANEVKLFMNGVQIGTTQTYSTPVFSATLTAANFHGLDDLVLLNYAADPKLIRAIYESNAPVFVESSVFHWRSPSKAPIWVDEFGLWGRGVAGGEIIGIYGGDPRRVATSTSWGGRTMEENDVVIGRGGSYLHWDDSANTLTIAGNGAGITSINGSNITTGTIAAARLAVTAGGDNLLLNSSFEADSDSNGVGDSWTPYNNGPEGGTYTRVTGRLGGYAQRIAWTGTNTSTKGVSQAQIGNRKGGKTYVVSWWVKTNTNVAVGSQLSWNITPDLLYEWILAPTPINGVWQRWALRVGWVSDNNDAWYITITPNTAVTGSADWDDIMVTEGDTLDGYHPRVDEILPGTIYANMINVNTLSAVAVNTGSLTVSGVLTIGASGYIQATNTYLDNLGMRIAAATAWQITSGISFTENGTKYGGIYGYGTSTNHVTEIGANKIGGNVVTPGAIGYMQLSSGSNTNNSYVLLNAATTSYSKWAEVELRTTTTASMINLTAEQVTLVGSTKLGIGIASAYALQVHVGTNKNLTVRPASDWNGAVSGIALHSVNDANSVSYSLSFVGDQFNFWGGDVCIPDYAIRLLRGGSSFFYTTVNASGNYAVSLNSDGATPLFAISNQGAVSVIGAASRASIHIHRSEGGGNGSGVAMFGYQNTWTVGSDWPANGSNNFFIYRSGSYPAFYISSLNTIGLGTDSVLSGYKLDIRGSITFNGGSLYHSGSPLTIYTDGGTGNYLNFLDSGGGSSIYVGIGCVPTYHFDMYGSSRFRGDMTMGGYTINGLYEIHSNTSTAWVSGDGTSYPWFSILNDGNMRLKASMYVGGNISALSFTDRPGSYAGNAMADIESIQSTEQGSIVHDSMPAQLIRHHTEHRKNAKGQNIIVSIPGRDMGYTLDMLILAVKQLNETNTQLATRITELEALLN